MSHNRASLSTFFVQNFCPIVRHCTAANLREAPPENADVSREPNTAANSESAAMTAPPSSSRLDNAGALGAALTRSAETGGRA